MNIETNIAARKLKRVTDSMIGQANGTPADGDDELMASMIGQANGQPTEQNDVTASMIGDASSGRIKLAMSSDAGVDSLRELLGDSTVTRSNALEKIKDKVNALRAATGQQPSGFDLDDDELAAVAKLIGVDRLTDADWFGKLRKFVTMMESEAESQARIKRLSRNLSDADLTAVMLDEAGGAI